MKEANFETRHIKVRYHEVFVNMAEEQEYVDVDHMADSFESIVNECDYDTLDVNSLAKDAVGRFLAQVEWRMLAELYFVDRREEISCEEISARLG